MILICIVELSRKWFRSIEEVRTTWNQFSSPFDEMSRIDIRIYFMLINYDYNFFLCKSYHQFAEI